MLMKSMKGNGLKPRDTERGSKSGSQARYMREHGTTTNSMGTDVLSKKMVVVMKDYFLKESSKD